MSDVRGEINAGALPKTSPDAIILPEVNQRVSLHALDIVRPGEEGEDIYRGTVTAAEPPMHLTGFFELNGAFLGELYKDKHMRLEFFKDNRQVYGIVAITQVLEAVENGVNLELAVIYQTPVLQRREFFRLPINVQIYYKMIKNEKDREDAMAQATEYLPQSRPGGAAKRSGPNDYAKFQNSFNYFTCVTIDLSGGGFRCVLDHKPEIGDKMECQILLHKEAVPVVATVVRAARMEKPGKYDISANFDGINEIVRNRIIRHVFENQRAITKKMTRRLEDA